MGQLLSHPVEDKTIDYKTHLTLSYCVGTMQGYRMTMEDAHDLKINEDESLAVFAVFDGHGGTQCLEYLAEVLPRRIFKRFNEKSMTVAGCNSTMKDAFFEVDLELAQQLNFVNCGSTGIVVAIVKERFIMVANTGDSRCILSVNGRAKTMSFDHKPILMNERIRIENSNGYVMNSRINEILALSRAFGDFKFKMPYLRSSKNKYILENKRRNTLPQSKQQLVHIPPELFQVTVEPDVLVYDLASEYTVQPDFVCLACDGIWDCYSNDKLVTTVREMLRNGWKLHKIVEFVLHDCLTMANNITGIGFDNMTLIIVAVHPTETIDQWYERMLK